MTQKSHKLKICLVTVTLSDGGAERCAALLSNYFENQDIAKLKDDISKNLINMDLLKQAIIDTPSSLKMVDMSVYDNWLKNLES